MPSPVNPLNHTYNTRNNKLPEESQEEGQPIASHSNSSYIDQSQDQQAPQHVIQDLGQEQEQEPAQAEIHAENPEPHQPQIQPINLVDFAAMNPNNLNLESFKGEGDAKKWFGYFERYTAFLNLSPQRAALALPFFLKGIAKSWYDGLQETTQQDLAVLKTAFTQRFEQSGLDINILAIAQKQEESAEEYFSRSSDILLTRQLPENLAISIIMKGLKSELIGIVMPKNPKSLDELRQAMVLAEQTNKVTTKTVYVTEKVDVQSEIQFLRNQISEVLALQQASAKPAARDSAYRQSHQQRILQQHQRPSPSYRIPPSQPAAATSWKCGFCGGKQYHERFSCPASGKTCHFCHKKGHFQGECRTAKRSQNQFQS